jgi:glucose/arabinose dehydrogenase
MVKCLRMICFVTVIGLSTSAWAQLRTQVVASGFNSPVAVVPDPVIPNVLYVVEQGGLVKVIQNGTVLGTPFLDLRTVVRTGGERGLLGMAFPPNAAATGRVFVNFTNRSGNGNTVVARFVRMAANPLVAVPASRFDLQWSTGHKFIEQPYTNHKGGNLAFGPDGYLYIGLGDGGSGNDPENRAQDPTTLLGKFLRIDVNVADSDPNGFKIPLDNPFVDGTPIAAPHEIWSFGWRNPWRYSFDDLGPGATGALIVGDVGQGTREEIDYEPFGAGGRNYGWRIMEGTIHTPGIDPTEEPAYRPLTGPIYDYRRDVGQAVTGGYVYRGSQLPAPYRGRYFFADSVLSRVWSMGLSVNPTTGEAMMANVVEHTDELGGAAALGSIVSFGRDLQGELYLATFTGNILRIVSEQSPSAPDPPLNLQAVITAQNALVTWTPPKSGAIPQQYFLEAGSVPGANDYGGYYMPGNQPGLFAPGAPTGTYYLRVRSVTSGGISPPSNEVTAVVKGNCTAPPPAPTDVRATVAGGQVTVQWGLPSTSDGPTGFSVEVGSGPGLSNLLIVPIDNYTQRSLTGGGPSATYYIRMKSHNGCGSSGASNEIVLVL